jgi:predicted metal-dependent enzyme (double-stranded beta helix superfamily)
VQPSYYGGSKEQGFGVTILYEGTDYEILVETVCWLPGRGVTPNGHENWGVVVGLDGMETNINWHRKDDGVKLGYAGLEVRNDVILTFGQTCTFMPDNVHSVRNERDASALSLHVYGRNLSQTGRFEFDPACQGTQALPNTRAQQRLS